MTKKQLIDSLQDVPNDAEVYITEKWWYTDEVICGTEKANAEGKSAPLAADITYGFNAIGKIKELESLVAALRAKVGI